MTAADPPVVRVHGIANCDTVKRARAWLTDQGRTYVFHDFKKQGVPDDRLPLWVGLLGWERLLNRQGSTWRRLDAQTQAQVCDATSACTLMRSQPSVIKRPVVEWPDGAVSVGFAPSEWAQRLAALSG